MSSPTTTHPLMSAASRTTRASNTRESWLKAFATRMRGSHPRIAAGKDTSEWLVGGGTVEELHALVAQSSVLTAESLAAWRALWRSPSAPRPARVVSEEWSEPLPLQSELPPVQHFQKSCFPFHFAHW